VFNFFSEIDMIAMTFSTIGNRKMPLPRQVPQTTIYLDQTTTSLTEVPPTKRIVNPAIIGGMFQRIQNVIGCGSCGGAV
jgi:hypothetical protein